MHAAVIKRARRRSTAMDKAVASDRAPVRMSGEGERKRGGGFGDLKSRQAANKMRHWAACQPAGQQGQVLQPLQRRQLLQGVLRVPTAAPRPQVKPLPPHPAHLTVSARAQGQAAVKAVPGKPTVLAMKQQVRSGNDSRCTVSANPRTQAAFRLWRICALISITPILSRLLVFPSITASDAPWLRQTQHKLQPDN